MKILDNAISLHRVIKSLDKARTWCDSRPDTVGKENLSPMEAVDALLYRRLWRSVSANHQNPNHTEQAVLDDALLEVLPLGVQISYRGHTFYVDGGLSGHGYRLHVTGLSS
ncbi:MAG: hypothetical protein KAY24_00255 [Candidatus Eisenbacteria sp.]|nr:hypothetical protein [Candidatus Eisenbacteria bacterium]